MSHTKILTLIVIAPLINSLVFADRLDKYAHRIVETLNISDQEICAKIAGYKGSLDTKRKLFSKVVNHIAITDAQIVNLLSHAIE